MTDQEIQVLWNTACESTAENPAWNRHIRFARALLSGAIPEGHVVVPKEPIAYLFTCRGKRAELVQFASVVDNAHWPVDQWESHKIEPLYAAAPANKEGK